MKQEMRISDEELQEIKALYAENPRALKLLRKIFLPEITADAPISQNFDLWMTMKLDGKSPEEKLIALEARNSLIQHLENCLMQISILAGQKTETVEQTKARLEKNSSK